MALKFKTKEVDNQAERLICVGLIISDRVIKEIAPILDTKLLTARYTQIVANWCLEFWQKFEKAPRAHIQNIFEAAKRDVLEDDVADLIESLLISLNDQMMEDEAQFNEDYVLDEAEKYIRLRKATMLSEDVAALISKGQIVEAEGLIENFTNTTTTKSRPLQVDLANFSAVRYLTKAPKPIRWLLRDSFPLRSLGVVAGPPAAGKGTLCIQMAVALAAKEKVLNIWEPTQARQVLYVSAEDSQDVIDIRLHAALHKLDEDDRKAAAERIHAVAVRGNVGLCDGNRFGNIKPSKNLNDLRLLVEKAKPDVVFLDTLARFVGVDENDNAAMTAACAFVEEVIGDFGCSVILIHHTSKAAGDNCTSENEMHTAVSQGAVRGASALSGSARWVMVMAPLGRKLAQNKIGADAGDKPAGSYVAVRVAKKNYGAPEGIHFLVRGEDGLLTMCEETNGDDALADAYELLELIQAEGGPPLSKTRGHAQLGKEWTSRRFSRAVEKGLEDKIFAEKKKVKGKGFVLCASGEKEE